jgi:hypothetical protein
MHSKYETGHAKNVSHFQSLISFCSAYVDPAYDPSNPAILIAALQVIYLAARASLADVLANLTTFSNTVTARHVAFSPLKPISTKVLNSLASSGAGAGVIANAETINHKIQGSRATPIPPVTIGGEAHETEKVDGKIDERTPEEKHISASQQSYDQEIEHFSSLIDTVAAEPKYNPNETNLTVTALQAMLLQMQTTNTGVINAQTNIDNSRNSRNAVLYDPETGLVITALTVKKYVKSIYDVTTPQYKQIGGLSFRTPEEFDD